MSEALNITTTFVENKIFKIRNTQVMLDKDLAEMYGVELKRMNEQVKRNMDRFPEQFRFQLSENETDSLRSKIATLEKGKGKHSKYQPFVFTEQGVAIQVSIQIMNTFVQMRKSILSNAGIFQRLNKVEYQQIENNQKFEQPFKALEEKEVYHLGVSLKDLGKKRFAFSKIDKNSITIINSTLDLI